MSEKAKGGGSDPRLDFCDESFDPLYALTTKEMVSLPYPRVKPLDNIAQAEYILFSRKSREEHQARAREKEKETKGADTTSAG